MSNTATSTENIPTQIIPKDQWIIFLAEFTRRNRGAHGRLEVIGGEVKYQVETENKPFDGVSADVKGGEQTVWFSFGLLPSDTLTHGVQRTVALYALPPLENAGEVLAAEASDGSKTVLYLSRPEEFELPPAR